MTLKTNRGDCASSPSQIWMVICLRFIMICRVMPVRSPNLITSQSTMTKKITHSYFPKKMKYFTPIAFAGGIYLFTIQQPIWCALLIVLGILILTTNYVTRISLTEKKYEDYLSVLG